MFYIFWIYIQNIFQKKRSRMVDYFVTEKVTLKRQNLKNARVQSRLKQEETKFLDMFASQFQIPNF